MAGFVNNQRLDAEIVQGRFIRVIKSIEADIPKYSPERANIWAHLFKANLRFTCAQEICCHAALLPKLKDSIQKVFHPNSVFHIDNSLLSIVSINQLG